ncbi:MAG: DUF1667 domain-containing protein [Candidatus Neomarinimicrobiota bacterium]
MKTDIKNLVCIVCPLGCKLTVEKDGENYKVSGNACKRGDDYAIKEMTDPTRMLTSTMKLLNSSHVRVPVHTSAAIPKGKIFAAMDVINRSIAEAPVKMGDVLIKNILDTGADICASRSIDE